MHENLGRFDPLAGLESLRRDLFDAGMFRGLHGATRTPPDGMCSARAAPASIAAWICPSRRWSSRSLRPSTMAC